MISRVGFTCGVRRQRSSPFAIVRGCAALGLSAMIACGAHDQRNVNSYDSVRPRVAKVALDCLGSDSVVAIGVGYVGALRLDLPLDSLRRQCPNTRDTTATGDEESSTPQSSSAVLGCGSSARLGRSLAKAVVGRYTSPGQTESSSGS